MQLPERLRILFNLLKPSSHLLIVWVVGLLLIVVNRRRMALRCLAIGLVLLLIYTLPPLPRFLIGQVESTYPHFSDLPSGDAAVTRDSFTQAASDSLFLLVLGAGADYDLILPPGQLLSTTQMVCLSDALPSWKNIDLLDEFLNEHLAYFFGPQC